MVQIIPTILVKTFDEFQNTVKKIEHDFSLAQIDVMDGKFVPNITFFNIEKIKNLKTPLHYEVHLMVNTPSLYIEEMRGCFSIKKILFHIEVKKEPRFLFDLIRKQKKEIGIVINPETPADAVRDFLSEVDTVMVMGVHPGFSGQEFIAQTVDRVKEIRLLDKKIDIEIDGGVSDVTAPKLVEAGANILSVGSFMYQDEPRKQKEKILKSIFTRIKNQE